MDIYTYADTHKDLFNQLPGLTGLTTVEHKIAFANDKFAQLLGYKSSNHLADIAYTEIKNKVAEDHEFFIKQNNMVFSYGKKITTLGCHRYHDENDWRIIFCEKSPLIDHKNVIIGLINYSIDVTTYNLIDYSRFLINSSSKNQAKKRNFFYIIEDGTINTYKLSGRQIECLFFLLRGKSDKEIASILELSPRTIESYINEIKLKMSCLTRTQIIDKAFSEGLFNLMPESFIQNIKCVTTPST